MHTSVALLALALTLLVDVAAADAARSFDAEVARHIAELDSDSFQTRSAARDQLLARGQAIMPQLKARLKAPKPLSADAQLQLTTLIDLLTGGEAVDNLRIELKCDQQRIKPDDAVRFTVRIKNLSKQPVKILTGYAEDANFAVGGFFKISGDNNLVLQSEAYLQHGRAQTWYPNHELLEPHAILEFHAQAKLQRIQSKPREWQLVLAQKNWSAGPIAVAGNYLVQLGLNYPLARIEPRLPGNASPSAEASAAQPPKGEVRQVISNTLSFQVEGI